MVRPTIKKYIKNKNADTELSKRNPSYSIINIEKGKYLKALNSLIKVKKTAILLKTRIIRLKDWLY